MSSFKLILIVLFSITVFKADATTWNEPWMDKVISQADCFVLARVKSVDTDKGITINIIKTIAGQKISGDVKVSGFYLLHLCSTSAGEGPEYNFKGIDSCYFFLKKKEGGQYAIATPTSGFAWVKNGIVAGTYRHSYHQARTTADVYEPTMHAVFNNYHKLPYDTKYINDFVARNLATKPAGPTPDEMQTFYNQHIALECVYHLRLKGYEKQLAVFVKANYSFHAQVSAARALMAYNTPKSKRELMGLVANSETNDFIKVIALWTLESYKPVELKPQLVALSKKASTEENGFGGDIMDPRVCTHMPTVKEAIDSLLRVI